MSLTIITDSCSLDHQHATHLDLHALSACATFDRLRALGPNTLTMCRGSFRRSCQRLHRDLATGVAGDCELSGTTLCAAVLTGRKLTVANVGDSGCLLLSRAAGLDNLVGHFARDLHCVGGGTCGEFGTAEKGMSKTLCSVERNPQFTGHHLAVEQLSHDHKPECTGELERIRAAGGMVCPVPCGNRYYPDTEKIGKGRPPVNEGRCADWPEREGLLAARDFGRDVSRVWRASGGGPGLAMSRSIGDKVGERRCLEQSCEVPVPYLYPARFLAERSGGA